ncbi:MAG: response regulator, partial [Candidatus Electrothrix sp. AR5]|nr:response regulator [Candidatus Electrothrix sp. AR5]
MALAQHHHPNVILLDIRMPTSDGYEAARQIEKDKALCHIPIIAVTAFALQQDQEKIMADGLFDGFLAKPIQQKNLFRELARFVPYTEVLKKEQSALPALCPTEVPQDVSLLIRQLEKELLPLWQEVCRTKVFSDIERFAEKAKRIGKEHSCTALITYGDNLKTHSCNFAVDKMKTVLYAYPELIEQLTATQQHIEKQLTVTDLGEPREIPQEKRKLKGFVTNNHDTVFRSVVQPDFVDLHAFLPQL